MGIYGPPGPNGWISDMYDLNPTRLDTLDGHNGHGQWSLWLIKDKVNGC